MIRDRSQSPSLALAEHEEAVDSAKALEQGIRLTFTVAAVLIAAVALTWFGPATGKPVVVVANLDNSGLVCAEKIGTRDSAVVAEKGLPGRIELAKVGTIRAADECPKR